VGASFNTAGSLGSNLLNNGVGAVPSLAVPQGDHQSSDTLSSIAPGAIIVRNDLTQDLSGIDRSATLDGNGVSNDFNLGQIKENQALGQAAGYVGMRAAGDLESDLNLNTGSAGSIAIHTVVGGAAAALGGGNAAQGALGAGVSEAVSTSLANTLANQGIDPNGSLGVSLLNVGSALLGAAAGGRCGRFNSVGWRAVQPAAASE
jgi:filamentous hemagglutinin